MADDWQEYVKDSRTVCKYGPKCYQKNPDHHKQFKHPPVKLKNDNRNKRRHMPYARPARNLSPATNPSPKKEEINEDIETEAIKHTTKNGETENIESVPIELPDEIKFYDKNTDTTLLTELFLVEMPSDFFKFYEFITELGQSAEKTMSDVNLELIGPYDLLLGKLPVLEDKELYLIHWRFFYDPPEFQAIIRKKKSEYHIGYFRDSPDQKNAFLASNDSSKDCHITLLSRNIFGAVYLYLQNEKKISPFTAVPCQKFMDRIKKYAEENSISLEEFTIRNRQSQIVTRCFHGAGISVPYDKSTQRGYRRLAETDANLKKMLTNLQKAKSEEEKNQILSDLQYVVTNALIAVDEYDFGTGLELGINLFCSGLKELHTVALSNLTPVYTILNRKSFASIAEAHLKYRRKGPNMSVLNVDN